MVYTRFRPPSPDSREFFLFSGTQTHTSESVDHRISLTYALRGPVVTESTNPGRERGDCVFRCGAFAHRKNPRCVARSSGDCTLVFDDFYEGSLWARSFCFCRQNSTERQNAEKPARTSRLSGCGRAMHRPRVLFVKPRRSLFKRGFNDAHRTKGTRFVCIAQQPREWDPSEWTPD